jgi:hypothetical protein
VQGINWFCIQFTFYISSLRISIFWCKILTCRILLGETQQRYVPKIFDRGGIGRLIKLVLLLANFAPVKSFDPNPFFYCGGLWIFDNYLACKWQLLFKFAYLHCPTFGHFQYKFWGSNSVCKIINLNRIYKSRINVTNIYRCEKSKWVFEK